MPPRHRQWNRWSAHQEATYTGVFCGEKHLVPVDISAGSHQDSVEDCPVCCPPMTLHADIDADGEAHVAVEHEQVRRAGLIGLPVPPQGPTSKHVFRRDVGGGANRPPGIGNTCGELVRSVDCVPSSTARLNQSDPVSSLP
jgi:hypothetical protein